MTLTCAVNGEQETRDHPMFVCHHCGKPVCADHGWVVPADYAFDDSDEDSEKPLWQRVLHWREWRKKRVPQSAMHCAECQKKYHKTEYAHNGWEEPRWAKRVAGAQAAREREAQEPVPSQPGQHDPSASPDRPGQSGQQRQQLPGRPTDEP